MCRTRLLLPRSHIAVALLLLTAAMAHADEKKQVTKPSVEFRALPEAPGAKVQYNFTLTVTLAGTTEKFESKNNSVDAGFSGPALADFVAASLRQQPGWKYSVAEDKLIIEGWIDTKTKKFHPVKDIRFESRNLPKEFFPTVTLPRNKG